MSELLVVKLVDGSETSRDWDAIVTQSYLYDFYHLQDYHYIAYKRGEGEPELLHFKQGAYHISLPLLLRPLAKVEGIESSYWDASSVYGYVGPIASHPKLPETVIKNFQKAVTQYLNRRGVITVFSRLHPLIPQTELLSGMGEIVWKGLTVSIDLTLSDEDQIKQYRNNHKRDIVHLHNSGWKLEIYNRLDCKERLEIFFKLYQQTMQRVNASLYYFFERDYFLHFFSMRNVEVWLFTASLSDEIGASGIFTLCNGIVQYHLGASNSKYRKQSPMKLIFDEVRKWAQKKNAWVFHLGGGVGGKKDSLFHFKAGFSQKQHDFFVWRWIVNQTRYEELCKQKNAWNQSHNLICTDKEFFPEYRAPVHEFT